MTASEILDLLLRANLAAAAAIVLVLALRSAAIRAFGAQAAYALWSAVPLAATASLLPARRITIDATSAAIDRFAGGAVVAAPDLPGVVATVPGPGAAFGPASWLVALWLVGAVLAFALLAWRQTRFSRALGPLRAEAGVHRAQASGIGPSVVGTLFPRIVVPADFEARFTPAEREIVLAHEQAHLRRGDPWANAVVALAQVVCWFNPLVHVAAFHVRLDQELACDAAVVARFPAARRRYAEAMLKAQLPQISAPLACHWPARGAHPIKRRIALLKTRLPGAARRVAGMALAAVLSLGAGVAAWAAQPPRMERATPMVRAQPSTLAQRLGANLMEAIDEGYPDTIRELVEAGADVNHYEPGDGTPLLAAARLGDLRTARLLLERGAQVDKAAPGDGSPLIAAAAHGRPEMVRLLVEAGADVNRFVLYDETPLINAARHGDIAMVRYLVERGADPDLAAPSGNRPGEMRSPLSMAANPLIAEYLRSRGARR